MLNLFHFRRLPLLLISLVMSLLGEATGRPFGQQITPAFAAPVSGKILDGRADSITGQPAYNIASVDLSQQWVDLVRQDKVAAVVQIPKEDENGSEMISVRYGVRLVTTKDEDQTLVCQEFVEEEGREPGQASESKVVRSINQMLASFQTTNNGEDGGSSSSSSSVKFVMDGDFAAQLQLVRTLRPAPSPGFSCSTTSVPPAYHSETDSFVTGPLRLELRPRVGSLLLQQNNAKMNTPWDVYHNVSPADTRGHFLLLPTLADTTKNWRGQSLTKEDCNDMVYLASTVEPIGSLFLGYNSVGAGASQNHIHCHAWPSPPLPLQNRRPSVTSTHSHDHSHDHGHDEESTTPEDDGDDDDDESEDPVTGSNCYAVSRLGSMYDFHDVQDGKVEVSYLQYPVFCIQLSASTQNLDLLGKALAVTLDAVGDAPHNIGFLNRLQQPTEEEDNDDDSVPQKYTDVYVFARSKERSTVLPSLKLGISEMMGVFHAQSDHELEILSGQPGVKEGPMFQALGEISYLDEETLWESIKENLTSLD
jgi:hypothetical protein